MSVSVCILLLARMHMRKPVIVLDASLVPAPSFFGKSDCTHLLHPKIICMGGNSDEGQSRHAIL